MQEKLAFLQHEPLLKVIAEHLTQKRRNAFLVGGILRDLVCGRTKEPLDLDFAIDRNAIPFASELARKLKAGFVVLDREHGSCRIVCGKRGGLTLDFTDFRGPTIDDDLLHRDFTLNCLSVNVQDIFAAKSFARALHDPYNGLRDIKKKIIRQVSPLSLPEDPVRILRAFSLAAVFGFSIEPKTARAIRAHRLKLKNTAFERIREELFKIFSVDDSYPIICQLDRYKILSLVVPEIASCYRVSQGPYHHLDVWKHSLESLRQFDLLLRQVKDDRRINVYLSQEVAQQHSMRQLLKFGVLLHDIGKPKARRRYKGKLVFHSHENIGARMIDCIAVRLKLSGKEADSLQRMVRCHLRPGYMSDIENLSRRAIFRFFRDAKTDVPAVLLLSLADQRSTRGTLTTRIARTRHEALCKRLLKQYFEEQETAPFVRLVNGDDILQLGVVEGPQVGRILTELEELQAEGMFSTKEDALHYARKMLARPRSSSEAKKAAPRR